MAISALVLDRFVQMEELEGSAFARMNVMLTAVTSSQESSLTGELKESMASVLFGCSYSHETVRILAFQVHRNWKLWTLRRIRDVLLLCI